MILLACETSTLLGSVAVLKDGKILSYKESMRQGSHSEVLNQFIHDSLTESQINLNEVDLFVTGLGPGSFTGIRISLNTIKSLSYFHKKNCLGVDSLRNIAELNQSDIDENKLIFVMLNAFKNMVYVAKYVKKNNGLQELMAPAVVRVQELIHIIDNQSILLGDGFLVYESYLKAHLENKYLRLDKSIDYPNAASLAQIAYKQTYALKTVESINIQNWNQLLPIYIRDSEAEENLKGIKFQPLF